MSKKCTDEGFVTLGVNIPLSLKDKLKFQSYKQGRAIKYIVKEALESYLDHADEAEKK